MTELVYDQHAAPLRGVLDGTLGKVLILALGIALGVLAKTDGVVSPTSVAGVPAGAVSNDWHGNVMRSGQAQ